MTTFGELLIKYMHRIGMSNDFLGKKIEVTGEAIRKWKMDIYKPKNSTKVEKVAQILRLTELEINEFSEKAGFPPVFPLAEIIFKEFIGEVFTELEHIQPCSVMLLLTQANWGEPPCRDAILLQAKKKYLPNNVLHIQPPYILNTNSDAYFTDLGKQCRLVNVKNAITFNTALQERLENTNRLFLLISRFEQGEQRKQLAGIIRSLSDIYNNHLQVIFCGNKHLEELKFKQGALSLLNIAEIKHWPELGQQEVLNLCDCRFKGIKITDDLIKDFLDISGGHPQLLNKCLEIYKKFPRLSLIDYPEKLSELDCIWQIFIPFKKAAVEKRIIELLQRDDLGKAKPYIFDDLLRELYWKNLLVKRDGRLCWRCEAIKMTGLEIFGS